MNYGNGNVDCMLDTSRLPRLVWVDKKDRDRNLASCENIFRCIKIGSREPIPSDILVEVTVSTIIDTLPPDTKECYVAMFLPKDWDLIADLVCGGHTVILKDSRIAYDQMHKWVATCGSVVLSFPIDFEGRSKSVQTRILPSFFQLLEEWKCRHWERYKQIHDIIDRHNMAPWDVMPDTIIETKPMASNLSVAADDPLLD